MSNIQASDVSASVRSAFNFDVDKFPLYGPDNMSTDQYGLFRSDTGYIEGVKSISSRYVPHSASGGCALVGAAWAVTQPPRHAQTEGGVIVGQ